MGSDDAWCELIIYDFDKKQTLDTIYSQSIMFRYNGGYDYSNNEIFTIFGVCYGIEKERR